jgi:zinc transport system ATP-binding protein
LSALLECKNAAFAYEGKTAVSGLNFQIARGDSLCVVGENGSGKSTLLQGLLRLLAPCEGAVCMGGGLKPGEIGSLPQQSENAARKDFPAGVQEVVLSGRLGARGLFPFYSKADKRSAEENMRRLGVFDLRKRSCGELSGGQLRRVLLARALCAAKTLLLLDEPTAGLDPEASREFYRLLEKINKETGVAVVMVSHDPRNALRLSRRVLHVNAAQVFFGRTADYLASGVGKAFLEGQND